MSIFLIILAVITGGAGVLFLSEATTGLGFIAIGCLLGLLARIAQATKHHRELMQNIERLKNNSELHPPS